MKKDNLNEIVQALQTLLEDETIPKNVSRKVQGAINILTNEEEELSIRVHKVINELDEMTNDVNMLPYIRTQIWNIVSALEAV